MHWQSFGEQAVDNEVAERLYFMLLDGSNLLGPEDKGFQHMTGVQCLCGSPPPHYSVPPNYLFWYILRAVLLIYYIRDVPPVTQPRCTLNS